MLKKVTKIVMLIAMICTIYGNVKANNSKNILEVVQKTSEKTIEDIQGNITKTIVDSKQDEGEISIELKFKNNKADKVIPPEIFFVIDTSRKYGLKYKYR